MKFDKVKAMRNAERYIAQGNLRSAITEYRGVVDHDSRDVSTLNMLGDLYAKISDTREAVRCYLQVADHYNKQGFAQKAIAVYNKITRIQPDNIDVAERLAELHKNKGALGEARSHYMMVAEHHQKAGRRVEALAMYKQIAMLDPNNAEVCMSLADSYVREGQTDDAVEAYAEAGERLIRQSRHEDAIRALMRGFDIKMSDLRILNGLVKAQSALGKAPKAVQLLEQLLEDEPYNRDILYLLIDCSINTNNVDGAEKAVTKLVEIEPANYPKYLDLIRIYLDLNDPTSAARVLTMCAEYLLAGGQAEDCGKWIDEILERDSAQLAGLQLLVRYNSWLNDENGTRLALERLCAAAGDKGSIEDERYALMQLVVVKPHETRYRDRLNEINLQYGFTDEPHVATEFDSDSTELSNLDSPGEQENVVETAIVDSSVELTGETDGVANRTIEFPDLSPSELDKYQREIDSISFYIENDYHELAEKAIAEVTAAFGDRPAIVSLRKRIGLEGPSDRIPGETLGALDAEPTAEPEKETNGSSLGIDEIRSEFGLETAEEEPGDGGDYETHYQMAVAYQEMGLMEDAIREFQDAINLTRSNDGTRRFYSCATLLGHCFLQSSMAAQAVTWLNRALETADLSDAENHGLWYELARAYEAEGDSESAAKYFEKIYTENVDFRDVAERVKNLALAH